MEQTTYNKLIGTFEKLARAMTSRHDINVVPSSACATNGRTIYYPNNADSLDKATRKALHGWLDHEVGHICEEDAHRDVGRETPLEVLKQLRTTKEAMFLNVFEDIRMEVKKSKELIGVAENLQASALGSAEILAARYEDAENLTGADFWHAFGAAIIQTARGVPSPWLPEACRPYFDAVADEIAESTETEWVQDSLALAKRVIEKIGDAAEEIEEEHDKRQQEGQDLEDADDIDGEASHKHDGGESKEENGEGDNQADTQDIGDKNGSEERNIVEDGTGAHDLSGMSDENLEGAKHIADEIDTDAEIDDIGDVLKDEIAKTAEQDLADTKRYYAAKEALQRDKWSPASENAKMYKEGKQKAAAQIRGMKGKLLSLIKARSLGTMVNDQDEGELDADALFSVKLGNRRIYTQMVEGDVMDTAISMMLDLSGSMGDGHMPGCKAYYTRVMAIALAETFNALGIPFEVIGFYNLFNPSISSGSYGKHVRTQSYVFPIFKAFDEPYKKVQNRFGSIDGNQDNADGEALLAISKRLALRTEARKILFVLSDGLPNANRTNDSVIIKHLKDTVKKVTAAGIEVIGIGANSTSVTKFYNDETGASNMVVHDIDTLAVEVFKVMKERLLKNRRNRTPRRRAS